MPHYLPGVLVILKIEHNCRPFLIMEQAASPVGSEKALSSPPPLEDPTSKRNAHIFLPRRSAARVSPHKAKEETHANSRKMQIRALEAENRKLKAEVVKNYQLELQSEKMVEDVDAATERLKTAVLQFRREQKNIEREFCEEKERIEAEFHASNYF